MTAAACPLLTPDGPRIGHLGERTLPNVPPTTLRDSRARRGDETDLDSQASQHVDESIGAEELNTAAQQVADAWLTDSQELGCLSLLQAPRPNLLLEPDHKVGAHEEVLW